MSAGEGVEQATRCATIRSAIPVDGTGIVHCRLDILARTSVAAMAADTT